MKKSTKNLKPMELSFEELVAKENFLDKPPEGFLTSGEISKKYDIKLTAIDYILTKWRRAGRIDCVRVGHVFYYRVKKCVK